MTLIHAAAEPGERLTPTAVAGHPPFLRAHSAGRLLQHPAVQQKHQVHQAYQENLRTRPATDANPLNHGQTISGFTLIWSKL